MQFFSFVSPFCIEGCLLYLTTKLFIISNVFLLAHELNKKCATESPPHSNRIKYQLIIFTVIKIPVSLRTILDILIYFTTV